MARRKHPRLPSGYGSISRLSGKRKNPYLVRPPIEEYDEDGKPIMPKPICYTDTWINGFAALTAWKAGTYTPGSEKVFSVRESDYKDEYDLVKVIISDYSRITRKTDGKTFSEVYKECYEYRDARKPLSTSAINSRKSAYKWCESLYDIPLCEIRHDDFQKIIDDCPKKMQTKANIAQLFHQVSAYALSHDIIKTDYSSNLVITKTDVESGVPFSEKEVALLKTLSDKEPMAKKMLIMIYSGFRVSAYKSMEVNLKERYFKGGVKTEGSKNRIVPIHDGILPFVKEFDGRIIDTATSVFREDFNKFCKLHGMNHTPHDTRHTFSALCEKYDVKENDRKRMLGHKVGDITNDVYGHRTVEELRAEMHKIPY